MRYLMSARARSDRRAELLQALEEGRFGEGFPYGDLGDVLRAGRVDESGTVRWVEVCYCREAYGVAMEEEIPYFDEFFTDVTVADALNPRACEGYPACSSCDCTRKIRLAGEPFLDHLRESLREGGVDMESPPAPGRPPRWLGWRGRVTPEEARRNLSDSQRPDESAHPNGGRPED